MSLYSACAQVGIITLRLAAYPYPYPYPHPFP